MKFTITRKNTNDKFIVSSINDSKKSSKLSRAKISDAEIYKCRIIRFLDAVAATNESEKAGLSPEQLKKLSLSSKANTVANVLVEHKDEFSANVFLTHFFLVIHDIIENNVTYHILSRTKLRAVLKTRVIKGYKF